MNKQEHIESSVEALLFSTGRSLSDEQLASLIDEDIKYVRKALRNLQKNYDERNTSIKIYEENKKWRMLVKDEYIKTVRKVVADTELTKPLMETLAVIAFRHPNILQSEVVNARGSVAYEHIRELLNAGFISRTKLERSFNIKLTEKFFEYFDVDGPKDIRAVFEETTPDAQQKLGELTVIDIVEEKEEIEDEVENPFMTRELGTKPELTDEERSRQKDFLKNIDDQIETVSNRNDQHSQDDIFKKPINEEANDYLENREEDNQDDEIKSEELDDSIDLDKI